MKGICDKCGRSRLLINTRKGMTGKNICIECYRDDPAHHEECKRCHKTRPVAERLPDGKARCASCYNHCRRQHKYEQLGYANCSWCGHYRKVCKPTLNTSMLLCKPCHKKQQGCRKCGQPGLIHARGQCHTCYSCNQRRKNKKADQPAAS